MTTGWKLLLQQKAATATEEEGYRFFFLNPEEKPVPYNVLLLPTEKELPKMLAKIDSINQNGNALWTHYLKKVYQNGGEKRTNNGSPELAVQVSHLGCKG